jgi:hypothetical protein
MDTVRITLTQGKADELLDHLQAAIAERGLEGEVEVGVDFRQADGVGYDLSPTSDIVIVFLKSAVAGLGSNVGKFLWDRLRRYFDKQANGVVSVEAGTHKVVIESDRLPLEPPDLNAS